MKPGTLSKWVSRESQTCSKAASEPLATRKRFMAMYMDDGLLMFGSSCRHSGTRRKARARNRSLSNQPLHRPCSRTVRKHRLGQHAIGQAELALQHAFDHGAQVGGGLEIAGLEEIGGLETWPVGDDTTALHRAAGEQRDRSRAVIGAVGAVDARGAAELGRDHHDGVAPAFP